MKIFKITYDSEQDGLYVPDLVQYVKGKTGLKEAYKNFRWAYRNLGEEIFINEVSECSLEELLNSLSKDVA
jgi:hypothetical protein